MLLKIRDLPTQQHTMPSNAIRGHAAEFGVIAAKSLPRAKAGGRQKPDELLKRMGGDDSVPAPRVKPVG